jgi:hypothetical protein
MLRSKPRLPGTLLARCVLLALADSSLRVLALLAPVTPHNEAVVPSCRRDGERLEDLMRVPGKRRVAFLMRGEAFRTHPRMFTAEQVAEGEAEASNGHMYGYLRRLSCGPGSYERQEGFAANVLGAIDYAESKGLQVDLFGTTFPCPNNETFHANLSSMFGDIFKHLRILGADVYKTSSQITTIRDVYDQAFQHMKKDGTFYEQVYLLRWDSPYFCKHFRFEDAHVFPQDAGMIHDGNEDGFFLIPGRHMPCFHDFIFNSSGWVKVGDGDSWYRGCCSARNDSSGNPCGGGGECKLCIPNFWRQCCSDLVQSRDVSFWKSSCEGDPDKAFTDHRVWREVEPPSAPSWLPQSDVACDKA